MPPTTERTDPSFVMVPVDTPDDLARLGALVLRRRADAVRWTAALAAAFAAVPVVLDAAGVLGAARFCAVGLVPAFLSVLCAWDRRRLARRMRIGEWPADEAEVRDALEALAVERREAA